MSVVKMKKIRLVGLSFYKDLILNALQKQGCVELTATSEVADTFTVSESEGKAKLSAIHSKVADALEFFEERASRVKGQSNAPDDKLFKTQLVSYSEFTAISKNEKKTLKTIDKILALKKELTENKASLIQLGTLVGQLKPFEGVDIVFSKFKNTKTTAVFFGTIKQEAVEQLTASFSELELTELEVLSSNQTAVIAVYSHFSETEDAERKLSEFGFNKCVFDYDKTASEKIKEIEEQVTLLLEKEDAITAKTLEFSKDIRALKVYADYYKFLIEKLTATENFRHTGKTFLLEGYLPHDKTDETRAVIESVSGAVFIEFSDPTDEDNPPTLVKNRNPVKQTEFVTDMYSSPNYRESDPNKIVFFFFMLFMGVIMADVGYGLLMIIVGLALATRIKIDNGTRRLWYVIALSGIPTIIFGLLFNSVLGFSLPYEAVLPNPVPKDGNTDGLMTILLFCLGLGVLHIAVGYLFKAINDFKNKDVAGGILEGLTWFIFMIGLVFAAFNFLVNYLMPNVFLTMDEGIKSFFTTMQMPGIIMVVAAVFIAMIGAGRNEKGFGKFTKGFGSVYGIINILSDILSYARLFGLMLSGMIIASTFNDMGMGMIAGGGVGYVFGGLVMVVGHVFNIAMGVLGAYIHNSRLQYIEFFGKFYTGEGEKFTPLGSQFDFIHITDIQR